MQKDSNRSSEEYCSSLDSASKKPFALNSEIPKSLVIHCADPRFRSAFQEFVRIELGVSHHTLLSLAGGVGPFVLFEPDSVQATQMIDQLHLFMTNNVTREVIILNHADCRWYSKQLPDLDMNRVIDRQLTDLRRFAHMVRIEIADLPVQSYFAVLEKEEVHFKKVPSE